MSLHLIEDDIYLDVEFTYWQSGGQGGGFSYTRTAVTNWLELLKEFPKIKFLLLGSQDKENISNLEDRYLIDNIKNYIEHVEFNDDVLKYIIMSDCVVMPSYREGTSRALLEAASVGRPLIATDVPGCNNIVIDEYNGYLCKKGDIESLSNTLIKMINTPFDKRKIMSLKSRELIEKEFDVTIVNKRIINEINKLNNEKL